MTNKIYSTYEIKAMISGVAAEYGIETVYLFGSYARGQATEKSDIDLYLPALPDKMGIKYFAMLEKLKEITQKDIDIITDDSQFTTPEQKKALFMEINSDKVLIYNCKWHTKTAAEIEQGREKAAAIMGEVVERIKAMPWGDSFAEAYLFGSYARGDFDDESDIDFFVALNMSLEQTSALNNDMAQIDSDISLEHDITVSTIVQPAEHFRKYADSHPLFINVLREGIRFEDVAEKIKEPD